MISRREIVRTGATAAGLALTPRGLAAEYQQYDGLGLAQLIAKKQVTPLELLNAVRTRVEAVNPKLNALCQQFFEKAEAQIKLGLPNGPFRGVPFVLKDINHQLAGTPTTNACSLFKDAVYDFDGTLVMRYKQAGLAIFGKTTTPEMGVAPSTESAMFGVTRNPWNLGCTAGGSSGGSAALVAARVVPMAHGSDGGGSIRIPASCCGIFGLKPTRGRVPLGPTALEGWNGMAIHHAVTISVRDSAALLDTTAGPELGSPYWAPPMQRPFLQEVGVDPGKLRMALVLDSPGTAFDRECRKAAEEAARLCESLGHRVEAVRLPVDLAALAQARAIPVRVSLARVLEDRAAALGRRPQESDLEPVTWAFYQMGVRFSSLDYSRALANGQLAGLAMAKFLQTYDVILGPTLAQPPAKLGVISLSRKDLQGFLSDVSAFHTWAWLFNVTGQPSMSVPIYWTSDGLPIGVMFSARFGDEATLFRLAAQIERARPWAHRRPDV
jgi:Asp-tRNA(Asn)/Glu-tRNA(Gln) amidotransferase A subunit family amidase